MIESVGYMFIGCLIFAFGIYVGIRLKELEGEGVVDE